MACRRFSPKQPRSSRRGSDDDPNRPNLLERPTASPRGAKRNALVALGSLGLLVAVTGCPDPDGSYDEFVNRHGDIYGMGSGGTSASVGVGGGCTAPAAGELDGDYFFSLVASQSPDKPAPLRATLTTTDGAAGLEFSLSMQPLNADDRTTTVGSPFTVGPFEVGSDGSFAAALGSITIPPDTNPLSGSELVADPILIGNVCRTDYFCGGVTGQITSPIMLPLDGSTWTMESLDTFAEPPKLNCAGDLAAAL